MVELSKPQKMSVARRAEGAAAKRTTITLRPIGLASPPAPVAAKRMPATPKIASQTAAKRTTALMRTVKPVSPSRPPPAAKPAITAKPMIAAKPMATRHTKAKRMVAMPKIANAKQAALKRTIAGPTATSRPAARATMVPVRPVSPSGPPISAKATRRTAAGGTNRPDLEIPRAPVARLSAAMPCDTAFRIIARSQLGIITALAEPTCRGDPRALHKMRLALTRLRAAIRFFSPMVDDAVKPGIDSDLRWLNGKLGSVRDLDVVVERVAAEGPKRLTVRFAGLDETCADAHRELAQSLRSARFQRLIARTDQWVTSGPWSTMPGRRPAKRRAATIAGYGARKLPLWVKKLRRKCRKLGDMDDRTRHRLRIFTKRLICSIMSFEGLFTDKALAKHTRALKPLHEAQRSLGYLNDDVRGQAIQRSLHKAGVDIPLPGLRSKHKKRLLRTAEKAYRKVATLNLTT